MAKKIVKTEPVLPEAKPVKAKKVAAPKSVAAEKAVSSKPKAVKAAKTVKAEPAALMAVEPYSKFTEFDISLFQSGKHYRLYDKFGSHVVEHNGVVGTYLQYGRQTHSMWP